MADLNVFEMTNMALKNLDNTTKAKSSVNESVKRVSKKTSKPNRMLEKKMPKIGFKKLKLESTKFMEEAEDDDFNYTPDDEVVLVIDTDMEEVPATEEDAVAAAQELVGDTVCKCSVCGANYVCECDGVIEEDVDGETTLVAEDGVCPVCGEECTQIVVGEIVADDTTTDVEVSDDEVDVEVSDDEDFDFEDEDFEIEEACGRKSKKSAKTTAKKEACDDKEDDKKSDTEEVNERVRRPRRRESVKRPVRRPTMQRRTESTRRPISRTRTNRSLRSKTLENKAIRPKTLRSKTLENRARGMSRTATRPNRLTRTESARRPISRRPATRNAMQFNEKALNRLFTKFATENYSNVKAVKFTGGAIRNNKLTLEGTVLTTKNTKRSIRLVSENFSLRNAKNGKLTFAAREIGPFTESAMKVRNRAPFAVECVVRGTTVSPVALKYAYQTKNNSLKESKRNDIYKVFGKVK